MAQTFRLDTREFNRLIRVYARTAEKTLAESINRKMVWIVRKAIWYTPKADYEKMGMELGRALAVSFDKQGKRKLTAVRNRKKGQWWGTFSTAQAPLEQLANDGWGRTPIVRLRFRCAICGGPAQRQLRPPAMPAAQSRAGWITPPCSYVPGDRTRGTSAVEQSERFSRARSM